YESGLWFQGKSLSKSLSAKDAPKNFLISKARDYEDFASNFLFVFLTNLI
ncbi:unnamed protein product, partial [Prunus brigantina]